MRIPMKYMMALLITAISMTAAAQMPPEGKVRPVAMRPKDTLQQVMTTRTADHASLKDEKNGQVVYKGIFSYRDMEQEPTFSWLPHGMDEYNPDATATDYLQKTIGNYKLVIFLGTWCEDSQHLLPQLFKVLEKINIAWEDLMLIGMDRTKTTNNAAAQQLAKRYNIALLPTIVVLNSNDDEIGRITETVSKSVEWDLVSIIGGQRK
ncbi:hypothetical protein GCM10023093_10790 [Nemorincola caseinilytica]|uniref:Thioredoxin n=1 Tax=Nemorincola caseinilytica TaxID=2054315 RepID=A0ABP8NCN4_9BACT